MNAKAIVKFGLTILLAAAAGYGLARWQSGGTLMADMDRAGSDRSSGGMGEAGKAEVDYWVAPMDANFRRDKPGKSPMGMDLIPVYKGEGGNGGAAMNSDAAASVQIAAQVVQNLGVRTAVAKRGDMARIINTVGYTAWDESTITMLHPRAEGWLERFNIASVGDELKKGEEIYALFAPKLVSAQAEYLNARRSGNRGLIRAARSRLLALGFTENQVRNLEKRGKVKERLEYRAERDGVVTAIMVRQGSYVTPATHITTLADPAAMWVDVEVLQSQAAWIKTGLKATASFSGYPGEEWVGEVAYVYPELDAATRTLRLRLRFANADGRLKPNMFSQVTIAAEPSKGVLKIPREAVLRAAGGERVVVATGNGNFDIKIVRTGAVSAELVEVIDGLEAGDKVVVSGQFLIDSEANGAQALARLQALRTATTNATILGFPRRGQLRLQHEPIPSLDWPAMNMVFSVASDVNLMPFNKADPVGVTIKEQADGAWKIMRIEALDSRSSGGMGMEHSRHDMERMQDIPAEQAIDHSMHDMNDMQEQADSP